MSNTQFKIGDLVTYKTIDKECETRGYGISWETRGSTIVSIYYKMANGDLIEAKHLVFVQSKSEEPKTTQNGSSS